jgi:murein tripeptide amidase MpaA
MRASVIILIVSSSGIAADQPKTVTNFDEKYSFMVVPQLSADRLPDFNRGGFDVVRTLPDGSMEVVATSRDRDVLITDYNARIQIDDMEAYYSQRLDPTKDMGGYHTYDETIAELTALHAANPTITRLDTIGYSYEGRAIFAFKISDNVDVDETDEPEVQFNGLVHAREPMGLEICMTMINYLLDNQTDPDIADVINTTEIWFVPIINVDGYVYNQTTNPTGGGMWRKNRTPNYDGSYGTDLNRNWGFNWGLESNSSFIPTSEIYCGTEPFSEPATAVLRDFFKAHDFVAAINFHSYGNVVLYPFGAPDIIGCPDDPVFDPMCANLSGMIAYDYATIGGLPGFGGDAACWQYVYQENRRKTYAILIETATDFWPSIPEMEDHCQRHISSNLYLIDLAHELMNHPGRWMTTDLTFVDTTIDDCSSDFSSTFTFHNTHETSAISISATFNDFNPSVGWCTATSYSGIVNPGDSFSINFDFYPDQMFGLADGTTVRGRVSIVAIAQDENGYIDLIDYWVKMRYSSNDLDGDGLIACLDNCPMDYNPDQTDQDADGIGDVCDNCIGLYNPDQADFDRDGAGDLCDICPGQNDFIDSDDDDVADCVDNCPSIANTDQSDGDEDGLGDACDNCPGIANEDQLDADEDNVGDVCDVCPGFDDLADADGDDVPDSCDNCPTVSNPDQADGDENGIGDACQYMCGDASGDRALNVGDAVHIITYIFKGGPAPDPLCSADANGDAATNIADAVYLITYIFKSGPAPVEPCCP